MEFVYPILIFVVMGIVFGVLLVVISKVFAVKTDERAGADHRSTAGCKLRSLRLCRLCRLCRCHCE